MTLRKVGITSVDSLKGAFVDTPAGIHESGSPGGIWSTGTIGFAFADGFTEELTVADDESEEALAVRV